MACKRHLYIPPRFREQGSNCLRSEGRKVSLLTWRLYSNRRHIDGLEVVYFLGFDLVKLNDICFGNRDINNACDDSL